MNKVTVKFNTLYAISTHAYIVTAQRSNRRTSPHCALSLSYGYNYYFLWYIFHEVIYVSNSIITIFCTKYNNGSSTVLLPCLNVRTSDETDLKHEITYFLVRWSRKFLILGSVITSVGNIGQKMFANENCLATRSMALQVSGWVTFKVRMSM